MKTTTHCFPLLIALGIILALTSTAFAQSPLVELTNFENVNTNALGTPFGSWTYASMNPGSNSFDVHATNYGGVYDPLSPYANATGCSNIVLTINWTNTSSTPNTSGDGFILTIGDVHTSQLVYQFYNLPTGQYVVTRALYPADIVQGSGTLDLTAISYIFPQGDSGPSGYSEQWQDLKLAGAMTNVEILTFHNYHQDAQYGAWANGNSPTIVVGPTNWTVTATGGGSDWVYLGGPNGLCNGAGQTNLALTVDISGLSAGAIINPYVELLDTDGTDYVYTWYNLSNGHYVLSKPVQSPTTINAPGSTNGLDLAHIRHSHIGVDTGGLQTRYTISFDDLSLTSAAPPPPTIVITSESYDPQAQAFTLTWTSTYNQYYSVLSTSDLTVPMSAISVNIPSGGTTTTTTVSAVGNAGFFQIQQQ